jgi:hypothetical protein
MDQRIESFLASAAVIERPDKVSKGPGSRPSIRAASKLES